MKDLTVAVTGIKIALAAMAISVALSIIPLSLSLMDQITQITATKIVILIYSIMAATLLVISLKIKLPEQNNFPKNIKGMLLDLKKGFDSKDGRNWYFSERRLIDEYLDGNEELFEILKKEKYIIKTENSQQPYIIGPSGLSIISSSTQERLSETVSQLSFVVAFLTIGIMILTPLGKSYFSISIAAILSIAGLISVFRLLYRQEH